MSEYISKSLNKLIVFLSIAMAVFHLYTAFFGPFTALIQRNVHLSFGVLIAYLTFLASSKYLIGRLWYSVISLLSIFVTLYFIIEFNDIILRFGYPNTMDIIVGVVTIIIVLDFTRKTAGNILIIIAFIFILYALFGALIPGFFGNRGYAFTRVINQISISTEGIFGTPLGVSAKYIYLFVLFGSLLKVTGIAQFYIDIANKLVGKSPGGPAKAAIIASGFFGSVSGSAVANVSGTGTITIPLMKSVGYKKEFAGGIEAVASTGGQFMPPLMGASAFIMAEIIGMPYYQVVLAAVIPALLYYSALFSVVHFKAYKEGLTGVDTSKYPPLKTMLIKKGWLFLPLISLLYFLLVAKLAVMKAAVYSVLITMLIGFFVTKKPLKAYAEAMTQAVKTSFVVIASTACAGIIVGVVNLTGIGLKFSALIVFLSNTNLLLILVMLMLASILLGMGLPTTPAYLILAVLGAPALIDLGIDPLPAHMFVFYFGAMSMITPPVALAVFAASSIAESNFWPTGFSAIASGFVGFIVPYMFIYNPSLLGQGGGIEIAISAILSLIGAVFLGAGMAGWLFTKIGFFIRGLLVIIGVLFFLPIPLLNVISGVILISILFQQLYAKNKKKHILSN